MCMWDKLPKTSFCKIGPFGGSSQKIRDVRKTLVCVGVGGLALASRRSTDLGASGRCDWYSVVEKDNFSTSLNTSATYSPLIFRSNRWWAGQCRSVMRVVTALTRGSLGMQILCWVIQGFRFPLPSHFWAKVCNFGGNFGRKSILANFGPRVVGPTFEITPNALVAWGSGCAKCQRKPKIQKAEVIGLMGNEPDEEATRCVREAHSSTWALAALWTAASVCADNARHTLKSTHIQNVRTLSIYRMSYHAEEQVHLRPHRSQNVSTYFKQQLGICVKAELQARDSRVDA